MTDMQPYLDSAAERLRSAGYDVRVRAVGGVPTLTGYRADFRWRWFATKLHLFVCIGAVPVVTLDQITAFTQVSLQHVKDAKGQSRGMQSGVAVISALVGDTVDDDAAAYARSHLERGFAAFAWPVTVDLGTGTRTSHRGRPMLGAIYSGWMRKQIEASLPPIRVPAA
jgi:hypothetical protein